MAQTSSNLFRLAVLVSVFGLLMLVDGALVTTSGLVASAATPAGASGPPGVSPAIHLLVLMHPWLGAVLSLLTLSLVVVVMRSDQRPGVHRLSWFLLVLVLAQGGLGSRGAMALSPAWMGTLHACIAQVFFASSVALTIVTSTGWFRGPDLVEDYGWPSMRSFSVSTPVLLLFQVYLGAALRHRAIGALPHLGFAMLAALWILMECAFIIQQFPQHRTLRPAANGLLGVTCAQVFLGIGAFTMRTMELDGTPGLAAATAAHVATGALTLALCVVLSIQIRRNVMPKGSLSTSPAAHPVS